MIKALACILVFALITSNSTAADNMSHWLIVSGGTEHHICWTAFKLRTFSQPTSDQFSGLGSLYFLLTEVLPENIRLIGRNRFNLTDAPKVAITPEDGSDPENVVIKAIQSIARASGGHEYQMKLQYPFEMLVEQNGKNFVSSNAVISIDRSSGEASRRVREFTLEALQNRRATLSESELENERIDYDSMNSNAAIADVWRRFLLKDINMLKITAELDIGVVCCTLPSDQDKTFLEQCEVIWFAEEKMGISRNSASKP